MKKIILLVFVLLITSGIEAHSKLLCAYFKDSTWIVVNYDGEIIEPEIKIKSIGGYSEGFLRIKTEEDKWVFLDDDGNLAIEPDADLVRDFNSGLACVIKKDSLGQSWYGFIDTTGKLVIPHKFTYSNDFSEEIAYATAPDMRGYIMKDGNWYLELKKLVGYDFSEGISAVSTESYEVGFINISGEMIIKPQYLEPHQFKYGLCPVVKKAKFGYIDTTNTYIIPELYDDAREFYEGLAIVGNFDNNHNVKYGVIDTTGKTILPLMFDMMQNYSEGYSAVKIGDKYGFAGRTILEFSKPLYFHCENYVDGMAWASIRDGEPKRGFINRAGEFIIELPEADAYMDLRLNKRVFN
ncbi:MAG: WG repeat-containing protein [Candidatus Kapaibacterium sp.]